MADNISKEERLEEESLNEEQLEEQELEEEKSTETIPRKDYAHFWKTLTPPLLGAVTALLIATFSSYLVVHLTQEKYEEQEKLAVLRLLEVAEADVMATGLLIEGLEDRQSKAVNLWTKSGVTLPYPILFTKAMTDNRVLVNLSTIAVHTIYSIEKELDKNKNIIMYTNEEDSIKSSAYAEYKSHLRELYSILHVEIKYQKNESNEEKLLKEYKDVVLRTSGLTEEEFERLLNP